ncbi:MAG TPA: hypothetical protein VGK26_02790 [Thermoanaerobaculia bacterium]
MPSRASVSLLGAALLAAYSVAALPWSSLGRRPRTPFDASASGPAVASGYVLLRNAADRIPAGASVAVATSPRDPIRDEYFQRFAIALLPRAHVLPAGSEEAEFVIVVGVAPREPPGVLLQNSPEGSLWHRVPR